MSHRVVDGYLEILHEETNAYVPGSYVLPVAGGHKTALNTEAMAILDAIVNRLYATNEYPIPANQLAQLVATSTINFPNSLAVSNFPTGFACSNLPAAYALPTVQEAMLSGLQTTVDNLSKGLAAADANTLRVTVATNQPAIFTGKGGMTPISRSAAGDFTVVAPSAASKVLRISAIVLSAPTGNSIIIKQGTVGEGQTNLSGAISFQTFTPDYGAPIALAAGKSFVFNLATAAAVTGYAVTWEE